MAKEHSLSNLLEKRSKKKVKVTIYLPPDLVKKVRHRCIDLNLTLSEFIEEILEEYLHKDNHSNKKID